MPFAVPGRLQRVHREHRIPRRHQRRHPQTTIRLDPDPDFKLILAVTGSVLADQRMEPGQARRALTQPGPRQSPPGLIHQLDIVMILGPVITNEQNPHLHLPVVLTTSAAAGEPSAT
jgi:hypothetical protein